MKLTPYGKFIRKIRLEKDMILKDMANDLNCSSAYLSALETGRKPSIPQDMIEKIISIYKLTGDEKVKLRESVEQSKKVIKLKTTENSNPKQILVATEMAKKLSNLDDDVADRILDILGTVDVKNRRSKDILSQIIAHSLSRNDIVHIVNDLRNNSLYLKQIRIPILRFLEFELLSKLPNYFFVVLPFADMINEEGFVEPNRKIICLREDVYDNAARGDGRSRFTAAHECGHVFLYEQFSYRIKNIQNGKLKKLKSFEDPEWQANEFAGELLMPNQIIKFKAIDEISKEHGVTKEAAKVRKRIIEKHRIVN